MKIENGWWEPLLLTSLVVLTVELRVGEGDVTRVKSNASQATKQSIF